MPSYFYHIKFELYSLPESDGARVPTEDRNRDIWLPPDGTNIFHANTFGGAWPQHQTVAWESDGSKAVGKRLPFPATAAAERTRITDHVGQRETKESVIDCGPSRRAEEPNNVVLFGGTKGPDFPPPSVKSVERKRNLRIAKKDWRFGRVRVESLDMDASHRHRRGEGSKDGSVAMNAGLEAGGRATKARFEEVKNANMSAGNGLESKNTELGWGLVHLYREGEETPGLRDVELYNAEHLASPTNESNGGSSVNEQSSAEDCTILCVPAVPSYLTPRDFLGFVGEKTREAVSHFRMVMTGRMNRYLVLMKFRDGNVARKWKAEWDGKVFNSMEPETCHVVFIKSITFQTPTSSQPNTSFPELSHDPFTPASTSNHLKPFPPPTPNLVELPTCPVCLERMDDTTGLLTILCQHVFHCDCLQKWSGTGCPVCRHTNPSLAQSSPSTYDPENPPFGSGEASLCSVCDCTDDLWICLICGNVGCGRYKGGHAKDHWKESAHNFALEIETQHVWDYAGDMWVHRLIRDKGDSKIIELPPSRSGNLATQTEQDMDMVPRVKLENVGLEFTHLLTSQLESQRIYFEELVGKAAAKASAASSAATSASNTAESALAQLKELQMEQKKLTEDIIPNLEKELAREKKKAEKSAEIARGMGKSLREEKQVSEGLMDRIGFLNEGMKKTQEEMRSLKDENEELKEANRDLMVMVSGREKIREMEEKGELGEGEAQEAGVSVPVVPPPSEKGKKKGKGKR